MRQLFLKKSFILSAIIFFLFLFYSCEKNQNTIIDPSNSSPFLTNASFSLSTIMVDTIVIGDTSKPDDLLTIRGIAAVKVVNQDGNNYINGVSCSVTKELSTSPNGGGILHDDGEVPDVIAGDSVFSGYIYIQIYRVNIGKYWITFSSYSHTGNQSNVILLPIQIIRKINFPPVISNLSAPDTVYPETQNGFYIYIKAVDPNGQGDIKDVFRFTPSGLVKRFEIVMEDSIYATGVSLTTPRPDPGTYIFRFCAVDLSNDSSNVLFKTIVVAN